MNWFAHNLPDEHPKEIKTSQILYVWGYGSIDIESSDPIRMMPWGSFGSSCELHIGIHVGNNVLLETPA